MSTPYWTRAIEEARQRQQQGQVPFTAEQVHKAGWWQTCSCGEQDSRLHNWHGVPEDDRLYDLGVDFYNAVRNQRVPLAAVLIAEIEHRAAEVLTEMDQQKEND